MESAYGRHAPDTRMNVQCGMRVAKPAQGVPMRKLILTAVAVAGLAAGASAFAQASNYDEATAAGSRPADVPPGTVRGPSGELERWQGNRRWADPRYGANVYPDGYNRYGYANEYPRNGYPPVVAPGL